MGRGRAGASGARIPLLAAALLCAAGAPAAAQVADAPPPGLEVDAAAAVLTPLGDLRPGADGAGGLQLSSSAGARGTGIWWLGSRLGVGASGTWAPVDVDRLATADPEGEPVPGGKVADATYLAGSLEAVLSLPPVGTGVQVEPYLVAGAGLRRLAVEGDPAAVPSSTDPLVALGGGFRTLLSDRWLLRLETRDHVTVYGPGGERIQHDLTVSIGLGVRP